MAREPMLNATMTPLQQWNQALSILAPTSVPAYEKHLEIYQEWCSATGRTELLAESAYHFACDLHEKDIYCANTLWSVMSKIGLWFTCNGFQSPLTEFALLKKSLTSWKAKEATKKAKPFTLEELSAFIRDAPDDDNYLVMKVVFIIAVNGFLRKDELVSLLRENVVFKREYVSVKVFRKKTAETANDFFEFFIMDPTYIAKLRLYVDKFPANMQTTRFIVKSINSKATNMPIGKNTMAKYGIMIARFLGKSEEECKKYTAHSFRRSAATIASENGIGLHQLMLAGSWKSATVCQGLHLLDVCYFTKVAVVRIC